MEAAARAGRAAHRRSCCVVAGAALVPLQFSPQALDALHIAAPTGRDGVATATAVFYLFLLGVVGSGISTMVFVWMILKKGPLFAGMTTYVVPVLALLWGVARRRNDHAAATDRDCRRAGDGRAGTIGLAAPGRAGTSDRRSHCASAAADGRADNADSSFD